MTWTTKIELVDLETGEVLHKKDVHQGTYTVIKKIHTKTIIDNENFGIKWYVHGCTRNKQIQLWT